MVKCNDHPEMSGMNLSKLELLGEALRFFFFFYTFTLLFITVYFFLGIYTPVYKNEAGYKNEAACVLSSFR